MNGWIRGIEENQLGMNSGINVGINLDQPGIDPG